MTDQIDEVVETDDVSKLTTEKPPVDKAIEIQAKIDSAVKSRLAREKENTKALQSQWEEERKALEEENAFLRKQFQAKVDEELSDLPPSFRNLVSKLTIREQIEWLAEQKIENEKKPKAQQIPSFLHKESLDGKPEVKHQPLDRVV